ncbi:hypothetical protein J2754_002230 [Halarchaeum solikamskense]|uniref:hypothetical protein n=1 Tax=Halarchaeum nitratireducens TaxID=489913 RepID=UPI001B3AC0A4|nr:hypothetical protein [Halarchaeum solikamskense]MBP2251893.1 hypothetical protein [Halarchaeum solikamskense]
MDLDYKSRAEMGNGEATFNANFTGPVDAFTTLTQSPEGFSDRAGGSQKIKLSFKFEMDEPEAIDGDEDDVLAQLGEELDGTNITVRAQAGGPTNIEGDDS